LVPLDAEEGESSSEQLVAVDYLLNVFYPAICTYGETNYGNATITPSPKIFIVQDPEAGLEMLQSPDIRYSITGGNVNRCYLLPVVEGSDVQGGWVQIEEDEEEGEGKETYLTYDDSALAD
jgi:hypothetical protein